MVLPVGNVSIIVSPMPIASPIFLVMTYICAVLAVLFILLTVNFQISSSQFPGSNLDAITIEVGKEVGVSSTSTISSENLQKIILGAERGQKDSIYYLGLLKLYGVGLTKNPAVALENFRKAAALGHLEAQTAAAVMLLTGNGCEEDSNAALHLLKQASGKGDANAHWLWALLMLDGKDPSAVPPTSYRHAALLLQEAVDKKIPQAEHYLGVMYEYGIGMTQSFTKAADLYRRATEKMYTDSMYYLALMYAYGRGVPQDFNRALPLWESAARLGHAPSAYYVGLSRTHGYGCRVDYNQAINWFEMAASARDPSITKKAVAAMEELRRLMESAEETNEAIVEKYRKKGEQYDDNALDEEDD